MRCTKGRRVCFCMLLAVSCVFLGHVRFRQERRAVVVVESTLVKPSPPPPRQNVTKNNTIVIPYKWNRHPFWNQGMENFCKLVQEQIDRSNKNNSTRGGTIVVNFTTNCLNPYDYYHLGVGNIVMALYGLRLASATLGVDFYFGCQDVANNVNDAYRQEVLPWLQGYFVASDAQALFSRYQPPIPDKTRACQGFKRHPLHYMSEAIRLDLRNLAVGLFGSQGKAEHFLETNPQTPPLLPNTATLDDVAIHLRCGDVFGIQTNTYGFTRFDSYRDRISPNVTSIGIITQPFEKERNRDRDGLYVWGCRNIVRILELYLQHYFPQATISVRNTQEETQATAYARLVLANQTFTGLSTFSVFPAIAACGKSHVQKGRLTYFVTPIAQVYDNVETMNGPVLTSNMIKEMPNMTKMLQWLTAED